jgi:hypothetical protein
MRVHEMNFAKKKKKKKKANENSSSKEILQKTENGSVKM